MQAVVEEAVLRLTRSLREETGIPYLCLAGGVALNCVANGKVLRDGRFDDLWVQPAAGDAGGALGAALAASHRLFGEPRRAAGRSNGNRRLEQRRDGSNERTGRTATSCNAPSPAPGLARKRCAPHSIPQIER